MEPTDIYALIDCFLKLNALTNQSPFDRLVVARDVDGFPISLDALFWTPSFCEIVFCTVISQCAFNRRNLCLRFEKIMWTKRCFTISWDWQNKSSKYTYWHILQSSRVLYYSQWTWTPADIRNALLKVHISGVTNDNATGTFNQFAWKFYSTLNNVTITWINLFANSNSWV